MPATRTIAMKTIIAPIPIDASLLKCKDIGILLIHASRPIYVSALLVVNTIVHIVEYSQGLLPLSAGEYAGEYAYTKQNSNYFTQTKFVKIQNHDNKRNISLDTR